MKKLFLIVTGIIGFTTVMAQQDPPKKKSKKEVRNERISAMSKLEEEGVVTYKKHTVYGGKLTTDGYGAFLEIGRAKSVRNSLLFQLEISERKHVKEEKQQVNFSTAPIIYGKINFFYPVKLGVQYQHLLGNKGNKNGVSITANVGGGVSLGLLRPYKVDAIIGGQRKFVGYDSPDSSVFVGGPDVVGGPNFGTGWNELKVTPGLYLKPAVRFDYGKYNEMVSAIEVGLSGEFYSKKIPQMIYIQQKQYFLSAYVAILFGRRK